MARKKSLGHLYQRWLRQFSADAIADDANELQRHIDYLQLGCSRDDLLQGTHLLVLAVMTYLSLDGRDCEPFINQQRYWLCGEGLPHYVLTFELGDKQFGRVVADEKISGIDFADLFNHPWQAYETAGFSDVYISRLDGEPLVPGEVEGLEGRITEDIYYDYSDEEVSVTVQSTDLDDTALVVAIEN